MKNDRYELDIGGTYFAENKVIYANLRSYAKYHGWRLITRKENQGWRIWRMG